MFRLAHLTDPHLPFPRRPRIRHLASKRVIGFSNWVRGRKQIHRPDILDTLVADIHASGVDHIACTGDLVNIATPDEFLPARRFLERLGGPDFVSLVPGNHDAYAGVWTEHAWREWGPYMTGDVPVERDREKHFAGFPWLRRRGSVALVGISSAVTTRPFRASGRVGDRQLQRIADVLAELKGEDLYRIVLIHHSPIPGDRSRDLHDGARLCDLLLDCGADLVLHGHDHVATLNAVNRDGQTIPVICTPSASALPHGRKPGAQWSLIEVERKGNAHAATLERRSVTAPGAPLEVVEKVSL
ncbi:MAG: metallophosphoesterase [Flavobacteriaceae bacterium]